MNNPAIKNPRIAFFGTPQFAVTILSQMKSAGIMPALVVTGPDKPQGRGLALTPSPVKVWAQENDVPVFQPENLKDISKLEPLTKEPWDLFIVAAYGKILPAAILDIPKYKTLNVHPSLLPLLRGSSPIETAILQDMRRTGVTIMRLDEEMDHGPIVAQKPISLKKWVMTAPELENQLACEGGELLANTIPKWLAGEIKEKEQDHAEATYTKKIAKSDAEINFADDPYQNFLKIHAYKEWPKPFFFIEHNGKKIRAIVTEADFNDGTLNICKIIPEGKKETDYRDFLRGLKK